MTDGTADSTTKSEIRRKGRGRPAALFPRIITLKLRANLPEGEQIAAAATACRLPIATYLRQRALTEITVPPPISDIETASQIARVGNVFDQAVRLCQSGQAA